LEFNMSEVQRRLEEEADLHESKLIELLKDLIRTPSVSGHEAAIAKLLAERMKDFGYDQVTVDPVGNVIGIIRGSGEEKPLLYDAHMDTVPPGSMINPYSAKVLDGAQFGSSGTVVYGRGASDMKGSLASMVMAGAIIERSGLTPIRDLIVAGVVMEENSDALGVSQLIDVDGLKPSAVVVGEATNLNVALGHRGAYFCEVTFKGRSAHGSAPERGVNAIYKMARFADALQSAAKSLPDHPFLGRSTISLNTVSAIPNIENVIPDVCKVTLDFRTVPEVKEEKVLGFIDGLIEDLKRKDSDFQAESKIIEREHVSYTGVSRKMKSIDGSFYTNPEEPIVKLLRRAVKQFLGREPELTKWAFATDGWYFAEKAEIPTVGFGPGEERFAHTVQDNVRIEDVAAATKIYSILPFLREG